MPRTPGPIGEFSSKRKIVLLASLHGCFPQQEGFSTWPTPIPPCLASVPRSHPDLYPGSHFPLRPCTPRPGGCLHTILHSTHRRLLSLSLPSAACLCLRYPDSLQGKDLSYGRTFLEHWVRGPPLRGVCIPWQP